MSLFFKAAIFQRLANDPMNDADQEQWKKFLQRKALRKDLAKQALENDEASQVLMDMLLEEGEIKRSSEEMMNWIIKRYYGGTHKKAVEDILPGDWAHNSAYLASPAPLYEIVFGGQYLDYDTSSYYLDTVSSRKVFHSSTALIVREPPPDWNRDAIVRRIKEMSGLQ
jgi:hypothetical protein